MNSALSGSQELDELVDMPPDTVLAQLKVPRDVIKEQERRRHLVREGRPYHHWHLSPRNGPPPEEHWCEFCVGFFGVPHTHDRPCREVGKALAGERVCACIECMVAELVENEV